PGCDRLDQRGGLALGTAIGHSSQPKQAFTFWIWSLCKIQLNLAQRAPFLMAHPSIRSVTCTCRRMWLGPRWYVSCTAVFGAWRTAATISPRLHGTWRDVGL